jgi:hypothetical protein
LELTDIAALAEALTHTPLARSSEHASTTTPTIEPTHKDVTVGVG